MVMCAKRIYQEMARQTKVVFLGLPDYKVLDRYAKQSVPMNILGLIVSIGPVQWIGRQPSPGN